MRTISNITEFEEIIAGDKPVVLDFYADWCGPCRALLPVLEAAGNFYSEDIVVAKINVDQNPDLAAKFSVRSIPAVFLMKKGAVVDQFTGVQGSTEINSRIDNLISVNIEKPSN
ncbi:thioredoxin [Flavobacterium plurextorum]|uniref:thioredoxin n=1 Tax=Flavobacterium TaxID=237 RepID=UPI00214D8FD7|nr:MULTISPECIES: thioredoxin [Flavobacterium]UUW08719.1 thioredoxin [Flavobacterium plurextorum]